MDPIEGVDYSADRPSIDGLVAVGKRFACRYVGAGTADKHLDPIEAQELITAGLSIVANVEGFADGLLGGWDAGVHWATLAHSHMIRCGLPETRPIYFSVDFDVQVKDWPVVAESLRGAAAVIGVERVGVYGGFDAIAWAVRDQVARWFWQTYAWSRGDWHRLAHIQQYRNGVSLVGGTVDLDRAMVADYGQWPITGGDEDEMTPQQAAFLHNAASITRAMAEGKDTAMVLATWEDPDHGSHVGLVGQDPPHEYEISLAPFWERVAASGDLAANLAELRASLAELIAAPLIDAVAVATAIAAHPEISTQLAKDVAERLARIEGSISLSGGLIAGIKAPIL